MPEISFELNDTDAAFLKEHLRETGQSMDELVQGLATEYIAGGGK